MNRLKTTLFVVFLILCYSCTLTVSIGQGVQNLKFRRYSIEQGLSQASGYSILEDDNGYIWIGTQDGLNRFDGYGFKVFRNIDNDTTTIGSNYVRYIYQDKQKQLWVGTVGGGLNLFDPITETFKRYVAKNNSPNSINNNNVWVIFQDSQNNLWIGTDGGLNKYNIETKTFTSYKSNADNINTLSDNRIRSIIEDDRGRLWVGTLNGLNIMNLSSDEFLRIQNNPNDNNSLSNNIITKVFQDSKKQIWIATKGGGLNLLEPNTMRFKKFVLDPNDPTTLSHNDVYDIYENTDGNLWLATRNGLNIFNPRTSKIFQQFHQPADPESLNSNSILCIFGNKQNQIWVGTQVGGVNVFDNSNKAFDLYRYDPNALNSLSNNSVRGILIDTKGTLWIGTDNGLNILSYGTNTFKHNFSNPNVSGSISHNSINTIYQDKEERIWIGTDDGLNLAQSEKIIKIFRNNPNDANSISGNYISGICQDKSGGLWIGTRSDGLNYFIPETEKFVHYRHNPSDSNSLSSAWVRDILVEKQNRIWVGTDNGLNIFDPKTKIFKRFFHKSNDPFSLSNDDVRDIFQDSQGRIWIATAKGLNLFQPDRNQFKSWFVEQGLSNNFIYGILEDGHGNLWMSTNKGINKFNPSTQTFVNYDKQDGLQGAEFNSFSSYKSNDGRMFFGGISGLSVFHPDSIFENHFIPPVVITTFQLFNQPVKIGDSTVLKKAPEYAETIVLSYDQNLFSFEFSALNYRQPEKNQFTYKLDPFNKDWISTDYKDRKAVFTNIPPGEYTFLVKASNDDGYWNEKGTSIKIIILPPWWLTWWAKALWVTLFLGALFTTYKVRTRALKAQQRKLQVKVTEQTGELQKRLKEKKILYELSSNLIGRLGLDEVLKNIIDAALTLVPNAQGSSIFLLNQEENVLEGKVSHRLPADQFQKVKFNVGEGLGGKAVAENKSFIENNVQDDKLFTQQLENVNITPLKSIIVVLLKNKDKTIGTISLDNYENHGAFTQNDFTMLSSLAANASLAIERVRMAKEIDEQVEIIKESEKKLKQNELKLKQAFKLARVASWEVDMVTKELILNPEFSDIIGIKNKSETRLHINTFLSEFVHPDDTRIVSGAYQSVFEPSDSSRFNKSISYRIVKPDKTVIWGLGSPSSMVKDGDKVISIYGIFQEITPMKQIEQDLIRSTDQLKEKAEKLKISNEELNATVEELNTTNENLNKAYTQLKELDQYKESMTAMIVHDFKNSLNTVISFSEGTPTERRLRSIRQAGQFMLNMVMNILDLQKFESASVKMSLANYTVDTLISEAVDQLSYLIEQKAIKLTYKPIGQLYCRMDHDLTVRVIINILSNAIKYVPQNGKIDILATRQNDFVRIAIRDNGIGIPADKIHLVFEKYVQINAQKSGNVRSTGIGLTFCKMVVENLGGSIGAESEEGKGSTFYFTLPFVNEDLSQAQPSEPSVFLNEQDIVLNDAEQTALKPWLEKLRQWEVYDYSEVIAIIEKIENGNGNIALWKEQLMKALQTGNEGQFSKLVNIEK